MSFKEVLNRFPTWLKWGIFFGTILGITGIAELLINSRGRGFYSSLLSYPMILYNLFSYKDPPIFIMSLMILIGNIIILLLISFILHHVITLIKIIFTKDYNNNQNITKISNNNYNNKKIRLPTWSIFGIVASTIYTVLAIRDLFKYGGYYSTLDKPLMIPISFFIGIILYLIYIGIKKIIQYLIPKYKVHQDKKMTSFNTNKKINSKNNVEIKDQKIQSIKRSIFYLLLVMILILVIALLIIMIVLIKEYKNNSFESSNAQETCIYYSTFTIKTRDNHAMDTLPNYGETNPCSSIKEESFFKSNNNVCKNLNYTPSIANCYGGSIKNIKETNICDDLIDKNYCYISAVNKLTYPDFSFTYESTQLKPICEKISSNSNKGTCLGIIAARYSDLNVCLDENIDVVFDCIDFKSEYNFAYENLNNFPREITPKEKIIFCNEAIEDIFNKTECYFKLLPRNWGYFNETIFNYIESINNISYNTTLTYYDYNQISDSEVIYLHTYIDFIIQKDKINKTIIPKDFEEQRWSKYENFSYFDKKEEFICTEIYDNYSDVIANCLEYDETITNRIESYPRFTDSWY